MVALCSYALVDFVIRGGSWEDRSIRAGVPSSDYNWLTTYMDIAIPILVTVGITCRARWKQVVFAGACVLGLLAQTVSYTRAGWLGLMAEVVAFGFFTRRRWIITWMIGLALVIVISLIALSQFGYQRETVSTDNLKFRLIIWENALQDIMLHPLVGVGYGNDTYPKRYGLHPIAGTPAGMHSLFLMVAFGSGLPALGLLIWMLIQLIRALVYLPSIQSAQGNRLMMLGVAAMVVGFSVRNLFDYMFAGSLAFLFWILVAAGLAQLHNASQPDDHTAAR
jgi:heptosyltransferase-3/putative inorganic carbon (HCO3(-)) transporter